MTPARAQLCRGIWLPETERHFVDMIENRSKIGDRNGRGTYQVHKLDRAMELLPASRRRTAVDIGAHCGLWAMWLVDLFDFVECFEPVDEFARLLPWNVLSENWQLHPVALGDREGFVSLTINPTDTGCTHITGEGATPLTTLDAFDLENVDFVKIDVEGFELPVVRGAVDTIKRCRPMVLVEQKGNDQKNFGKARDGAVDFLKSLGMRDLDCIAGDWILDW